MHLQHYNSTPIYYAITKLQHKNYNEFSSCKERGISQADAS